MPTSGLLFLIIFDTEHIHATLAGSDESHSESGPQSTYFIFQRLQQYVFSNFFINYLTIKRFLGL